ncbi:MAG: 7-cyano-7-deazaguanine synthase QueC [Spirochaetia bacterium]|nr:7-cyano-7-deazaguanine synthase QueC [Spirochaetia bacterium]
MKHAVVLLSGGLDSATVLFYAKEKGFLLHALSFDYGQRHKIELKFAEKIASSAGCESHRIAKIDSDLFHGTALVHDEIKVPENRNIDESIPVTYVPARNMLFLSHALSLAESIHSRHIFIGANALDYSGYPDCRPEFFSSFEKAANLGTKAGVEGDPFHIETPILSMSKAEIIREGFRLGVKYENTTSCYSPGKDGRPCLKCDSCFLRLKGFQEAGRKDPLIEKFGIDV